MSDSRIHKSSFLAGALVSSLALNVFLLVQEDSPEQTQVAPVPARVASVTDIADSGNVAIAAAPQIAVEATPRAADRDELLVGPPPQPALPAAPGPEWTVTNGEVSHSLARTLQRLAGDDGDALSGVFSRLFVWEVNMTRDLLAGDRLSVVWRKKSDGIPEIAAASLESNKLGRTIHTYRWQVPGDPFPSDWHPDGSEVPLRLKNGPITGYEQITSLLKDRPNHKGMDFKTPVGTEVRSPRAGKVTRSNWNWRANGNCIEIRYDDGVLAKFLHLNENRVKPGERVTPGQVIALTGNTGRSTAPHLHYQLDRGTKTLDPLDYHGTTRRSLDDAQVEVFRVAVADFESMLGQGEATVQATAPQ